MTGAMIMKAETAGHANRHIKELLTEYPELGSVLNEYGIGCVTCAAGTCLLKDIVEFHHLPEERLRELMSRIARIIDPEDADEAAFVAPAPVKPAAQEISYSPPMRELVREHALIKRWLALIPRFAATIDLESEADRQLVRDGVDFFCTFADRFHHAKEEDILFTRFEEGQPMIDVMLADHDEGRAHVQGMLEALERRDREALVEHLEGYRAVLSQHIMKEDEILYPWMDRQFTTAQVGELYREFSQAASRFDDGIFTKYEQFVARHERETGEDNE